MTYDEAVRIIRTAGYTGYGRALVYLGWIDEETYQADYNTTTRIIDKIISSNASETISIASAINAAELRKPRKYSVHHDRYNNTYWVGFVVRSDSGAALFVQQTGDTYQSRVMAQRYADKLEEQLVKGGQS